MNNFFMFTFRNRVILPYIEIYLVLFLGIIVRLLYLDADPFPRIWIGYITDEGRWNEVARNSYLFGSDLIKFDDLHFAIAPLFQFINYLLFVFFDMSRFTARIFPAICGILIIVLYVIKLRKSITRDSLFLGVALIVFQPSIVMLSRVSVPEVPVMLFELIVFFLVTHPNPTSFRFIVSGLLTLVGVGIKATFLPFAGIFSIVILCTPRVMTYSKSIIYNVRYLMTFLASFLLVPFIGLTGLMLYSSSDTYSGISNINEIVRFIKLNDLYNIISFPISSPLAPTFNVLAIGVWIGLIARLNLEIKSAYTFRLNQLFIASGTWFVLYLFAMLILMYFPQRYKVHIYIPMSILIGVGTSILHQVGIKKITRSVSEEISYKLTLKILLFIFPSSVILATAIKYNLEETLGMPEGLRYTLLSIGISLSCIYFIFIKNRNNYISVCFYLLFPIIYITGWVLMNLFSRDCQFWLDSGEDYFPLREFGTIILSFAATLYLLRYCSNTKKLSLRHGVNAFSVIMLIVSVLWIWPFYINPQFTIRDTSIELGKYLKESSEVVVFKSDGLFLDNGINYTANVWNSHGDFLYPTNIVSIFSNIQISEYVNRDYIMSKAFNLNIYPYSYYGNSFIVLNVYKKMGGIK